MTPATVGNQALVTGSPIAVLDIDGTLVDSNYHHALAWYRALRSVGEVHPVWRLHRLIGMGGDQLVAAVGGEELERRAGERARERQGKEVDSLLEEMAPLPGARDLLAAVKERGHRVVLASSAQQRHAEVFLDKLDARALVDDWTTSADVDASKPAPDLLRAALKKLGAPPGAPHGDGRRLGVGCRSGEKGRNARDRRPLRRLRRRRTPGGRCRRPLRHARGSREVPGRHPARLSGAGSAERRPEDQGVDRPRAVVEELGATLVKTMRSPATDRAEKAAIGDMGSLLFGTATPPI